MDRVKLFATYALWIILFWILSDVLIYFGINSTYKDIARRGEIPDGIEIIQIQATTVNGRIKLNVTNKELSGKVLKIDVYSSTGVNLGTQYIEIGNVNASKEIETYFEISEVKSYSIAVVEEMGESTVGFMDTALSMMTIFGILVKLLFI